MNGASSHAFTAQYNGQCSDCLRRIQPGEQVVYTADDELVHADCPDAVQGLTKPVCPKCRLEHAGECF